MPRDLGVLRPILLIEDDAGLTRLVELVLTRAGIANQVVPLATGREAIELLASGPSLLPAVVLLDLGLPDMNGFEVIATIRDRYDDVMLPIVVLSGSVGGPECERALAAGANVFLRKPFSIGTLVETLEDMVVAAPYQEAS